MILRLYEKDKLAQRFFQKAKPLWGGSYKKTDLSTRATRIVTINTKIFELNFGISILDNLRLAKNPCLGQRETLLER